MSEVARILLRCVGVPLPALAVLAVDHLRAPTSDGYGTFLAAAASSLVTVALWAAWDSARSATPRVVVRWVAAGALLGTSLGWATAVIAPGSPPAERSSEAVAVSIFYGLPVLLAAGAGLLLAASRRRQPMSR